MPAILKNKSVKRKLHRHGSLSEFLFETFKVMVFLEYSGMESSVVVILSEKQPRKAIFFRDRLDGAKAFVKSKFQISGLIVRQNSFLKKFGCNVK